MDKRNPPYFPVAGLNFAPARELVTTHPDAVCITDWRVARLLLVLEELDQGMAGLETLPRHDLINLISSAIQACGFADSDDARYAIAAVLQAIEAPAAETWS
jgi:hypothetical protein